MVDRILRTDTHGRAMEITGHNALPFSKEDVTVRELKSDVELRDLVNALRGNNLDEVIFQTQDGKYYLLFADELTSGTKRGDTIEIGGLKGTVVAVDDECNEERWFAAAGVAVGAAMGVGAVIAISGGAATLYGAWVGGALTDAILPNVAIVAGLSGGLGKLMGKTKEDPAMLLALTKPVSGKK